jgi:hypothetical protein
LAIFPIIPTNQKEKNIGGNATAILNMKNDG